MNTPIELENTVGLMISRDYKKRFKAEYWQVLIRYKKLKAMVEKWDDGQLNFEPTCPRELYDDQLASMKEYIDILEHRAKIENITL